jgi:proline dehydrogenase
LLLYLSSAPWAKNVVTHMGLARRVARRFVAGERREEAEGAVRALNARGISASCDVLGESVTDAAMARAAADRYLELIDCIHDHRLDSEVSLKLTQLGLDIDLDVCREHMRQILRLARERGLRANIDMEGSAYTQRTLDLYRALRDEDRHTNLRIVIQSYLYRSDEDVRALASEGASLRLCKGAYKEPPTLAYPKKADVDAAYVRQMKVLLDAAKDGGGDPGIATHDAAIIDAAKAYAAEIGVPRDRFEFQMLYGIRADLQEQLVREGYGMRVYVPFGTEWYPYFMRRLAERPANLWFFASNFFR